MSWNQRIVACVDCGTPYSAKYMDDGSIVVPTGDNCCSCGAEEFSVIKESHVKQTA